MVIIDGQGVVLPAVQAGAGGLGTIDVGHPDCTTTSNRRVIGVASGVGAMATLQVCVRLMKYFRWC
jgi:hypothetical protein